MDPELPARLLLSGFFLWKDREEPRLIVSGRAGVPSETRAFLNKATVAFKWKLDRNPVAQGIVKCFEKQRHGSLRCRRSICLLPSLDTRCSLTAYISLSYNAQSHIHERKKSHQQIIPRQLHRNPRAGLGQTYENA